MLLNILHNHRRVYIFNMKNKLQMFMHLDMEDSDMQRHTECT